jgi:hypothetical protein
MAPTFSPDFSNFSASLNIDKTVTLTWSDDSSFETGFIISKSHSDEGTFVDLDSVKAGFSSYIDTSKKLSINTRYRLRPMNKSTSKNDYLETQLIFKSIHQVSASSVGNTIEVNWSLTNYYADSIRIETRTSDFQDWNEIAEVDETESSYTFKDNSEAYRIIIRVSNLLLNYAGEYEVIGTRTKRQLYNLPSDVSVDVLDENTIAIDWIDNSSFDEKFIVYQRPASNQYRAGSGHYVTIDTLDAPGNASIRYYDGIFYDFNIAPLKDDQIGDRTEPAIAVLISTEPTITNIESLSENSAVIHWINNNVSNQTDFRYPTKKFILEQSVNTVSDYKVIAELPNNATSYTVENLNSENKYFFRIRSLASRYDQYQIHNNTALTSLAEFNIDRYPRKMVHHPTSDGFVFEYATHTGGSHSMRFVDYDQSIIENEIVFDDFYNFSISDDAQLLAIIGGQNHGVYDLDGNSVAFKTSIPEVNYAVIVDNSEMYYSLNNINKVYKRNLESDQSIEVLDLSEHGFSGIYDFYKTGADSVIGIKLHNALMLFNYETNEPISIINNVFNILDINSSLEILTRDIKTDNIHLIDGKTGSILQTYQSINYDLFDASFMEGDIIAISSITSNQDVVLLFEKHSGEYLSKINGANNIVANIDDSRLLALPSNGGTGIVFELNKKWTKY